MIVSGDRDFVQLQKYPNVAQWDHVRKQFVGGDPISHLKSKVIRGDVGDGVPNFLSDDDTFVHESKRQKPITAVKEAAWLAQDPSEFCTTEQLRRNWSRNELLVDLSRTPAEVKQEITDKYEVARTGRTRQGIFEYLASRGLKDLAQHIQDF
jgi:hypothetical protein